MHFICGGWCASVAHESDCVKSSQSERFGAARHWAATVDLPPNPQFFERLVETCLKLPLAIASVIGFANFEIQALDEIVDLVPRSIIGEAVNLVLDISSRPIAGVQSLKQNFAKGVPHPSGSKSIAISEPQDRNPNLVRRAIADRDLGSRSLKAESFRKRCIVRTHPTVI